MINGKGWFVWKLDDPLVEAPAEFALKLKSEGFTHMLPKIADGTLSYNTELIVAFIDACHAQGLLVIGWQYYYGKWPVQEAARAKERIAALKLDGFAIDAEGEAKLAGVAAATTYAQNLGAVDIPVALSSYRWPSLHPELPWTVLMNYADYAMPQVYWMGASNAAEQLERCVREYKQLWPSKAIIPTGAAYHENGWQSTPAEIAEFAAKVEALGLTGYNYWEYANAKRYGLDYAVTALETGGLPVEPTTPTSVTVRSTRGLNLRKEPVVNKTNIIMTLPRGVSGPILEEKVEDNVHWVRTTIEGWVADKYYGDRLADLS